MSRHRAPLLKLLRLHLIVLSTMLLLAPSPTWAATVDESTFADPRTVCTITDERLNEVSGAVATEDGTYVANDKGATLFRLDDRCDVAERLPFRGVEGIDTEEVTRGPDGTIWLVDSGGNRVPRRGVVIFGRTVEGETRVADFAYPDRFERDAEAALVTLDDELVIFTKERGRSEVFVGRIPGRTTDERVVLERRGVLDVERIGARPGAEGSLLLTGASLSPDGLHVAVRTYTDIFEWRVEGGDVVGSILEGDPVPVAQVSQQLQGEAITYTPDAEAILALSEQLPSPVLSIGIDRGRPSGAEPRPGDSLETFPASRWALFSLGLPVLLVLAGGVVALRRRGSTSRPS